MKDLHKYTRRQLPPNFQDSAGTRTLILWKFTLQSVSSQMSNAEPELDYKSLKPIFVEYTHKSKEGSVSPNQRLHTSSYTINCYVSTHNDVRYSYWLHLVCNVIFVFKYLCRLDDPATHSQFPPRSLIQQKYEAEFHIRNRNHSECGHCRW